jgi:hypothetical protein
LIKELRAVLKDISPSKGASSSTALASESLQKSARPCGPIRPSTDSKK